MTRFHIGDDGVPRKCSAQEGNCPLGGEHFSTSDEARAHFESQQETFERVDPNSIAGKLARKRKEAGENAPVQIVSPTKSERKPSTIADKMTPEEVEKRKARLRDMSSESTDTAITLDDVADAIGWGIGSAIRRLMRGS